MSKNNEWDNIIKEKLGAIEEAPPAYMWDKIASGIPAAAAKVAFYQTTSFKIGAVAASIILLLGFGWIWSKNNTVESNNNELITNKIEQNNNTKSTDNYNANSLGNIKIEEKVASENINPVVSSDNENEAADIKISSNTNTQTNSNKPSSENYAQEELPNTVGDNSDIAVSNHNTKSPADNTHPKVAAEVFSSEIASSQNSKSISENDKQAENIINNNSNKEQNNKTTTEVSVVSQAENISQSTINNKDQNTETTAEESVVANNISKENINKAEEHKTTKYPLEKTPEVEKDSLIISQEDIPHSFKPKYRDFNRIGFGVHYGIESININNNQLISNNIDLSFNFQNLNFILQSGVGIQLSQDVGYYNLEYMSNDYLATEIRFDSASFVVDSIGTVSLVPVNPYYTDVYDSVHHTYNSSYNEHYYSIRIPVMIGYEKDFKKIGLFAKGGIFYSRVVYTQKTAIYEPDASSRMIKLNYSESERVSNQIEYVLSAGIAYRFSKKLHINGEIMTKFYQNSLYDNLVTTNDTWSAEGRLGLLYFIN